ncbi:hypothetical protein NC653_019281 [Populus alba x Populus x berolinensis]|uniref:TF-B3 domain-containing protein n=2 Tax=Populus alba x Populus x berolinensis TaxID=444605 RepID=A0AAD6QIH8_9ROSI|nr:hypothetical protein NC653_019281 [Populus alba x Populus x berolinensis]
METKNPSRLNLLLKIAPEMASRSEILVFSKELTKTDVRKRMSIPTKKLPHLPQFQAGAVVLEVEDERGQVWNMRCSIRKQKYLKPVISSSWVAFARSKNLGIGDKIFFYRELNDEDGPSGAKYKIKVQKATKVFGAIVGYGSPVHAAI